MWGQFKVSLDTWGIIKNFRNIEFKSQFSGEKVGGCTAHAKYCGAGTGNNVNKHR